ncbi:MAG TPA: hypothetical protein VF455_00525 [Chryseobacterium sp.]
MEVICLEDAALYSLVEQVVKRLNETHGQKEEKWISDDEASEYQIQNHHAETQGRRQNPFLASPEKDHSV